MDEATDPIAHKVQTLSDIELAVLLCLVVDQHCIIETDAQFLDGLEKELRIVRNPT
jgi:adenylate kinase